MFTEPLPFTLSTDDDDAGGGTDREGGLAVKERPKTKKPKMWKVLIHNDDFTTMEFVVWILMTVFRQSVEESTRIMLHVHRTGIGVAGVFTKELAETKVKKTAELARSYQFPLQCTTEEA